MITLTSCSENRGRDSGNTSYRIVGKDGKAIYIERKRPKLNEDYILKKKAEENREGVSDSRKTSKKSTKYSKIIGNDLNPSLSGGSTAYSSKSVIDDISENNDLESYAENLKRNKSNKTIADFDHLPASYFTDDRRNEVDSSHDGKNINGSVLSAGVNSVPANNFMINDYGVKNLAAEHDKKTAGNVNSRKTTELVGKKQSEKVVPAGEQFRDKNSGVRELRTKETVSPTKSSDETLHYVQLGTFLDENRAVALLKKFQRTVPELRIENGRTIGGQTVYKVLAGGFSDKNDLDKIIKQISDLGHREIYVFKK
ncbi:MAG: SPOR domain-containing protein [Rickettsiales bacterium]|nr:SPOR domain-containing protein [Rickettsiales bacterium]